LEADNFIDVFLCREEKKAISINTSFFIDIQYAQSAVFTPCDFAFPTNGIKAEATPNTEMTLIVDVDLELIKELNHKGAVTNLRDRRKDLYRLEVAPTKRALPLHQMEFAVG
jgi:hypothetical protein